MKIIHLNTDPDSWGCVIDQVPQAILDELMDGFDRKNMPRQIVIQNDGYDILNRASQKFLDYLDLVTNHLTLAINNTTASYRLDSLWVNYLYKNEFQFLHAHVGQYSFVIWYDIPFDIEDEKNASKQPQQSMDGTFYFAWPKEHGPPGGPMKNLIAHKPLHVDKTWNGTICVFPASMYHGVNPFKTSDDPRITIAGNLFSC